MYRFSTKAELIAAMLRLIVNPSRALATQVICKPLSSASIRHQVVNYSTAKTTRSSKDKEAAYLKKKLQTAKDKKKSIEQDLKDKTREIRELSKERKKKAATQEKTKLKEQKEAEKHKAFLKDTLREPRSLNVHNYFAKATKTPVYELKEKFAELSESEVAKYKEATNKYNHALKSILTPKPVLGPTSAYQNFVSQNYPPDVSGREAMTRLAAKWKALSDEEKKSFDVPDHEVERIKSLQKQWEKTREEEYPKLVKFKQEYKFTI